MTAELLGIKFVILGVTHLIRLAIFGQLAVSNELRCGRFVFRVKVSHHLLQHHKAVCFLLYLAHIRKTGELAMETRSCIGQGAHGFDATKQISLSRSTLADLAVSLRFLQKPDLNMYYSVYSSGLLADCFFSSLLFLAYDGFKVFCLDTLSSSTRILFIHAPKYLPILSFHGRCKHLAPFQSTSITSPALLISTTSPTRCRSRPHVHPLPLKLPLHHLLLHLPHMHRLPALQRHPPPSLHPQHLNHNLQRHPLHLLR